jgi:hypothetical protein
MYKIKHIYGDYDNFVLDKLIEEYKKGFELISTPNENTFIFKEISQNSQQLQQSKIFEDMIDSANNVYDFEPKALACRIKSWVQKLSDMQ